MANKPLNSINFGGANTYTVPNPISKTSAMTQQVGVDSDGKLWTAPSSGGGGSNESNVFVVEYGVTPFADIKAAVDAGKLCIMYISSRVYYPISISGSVVGFYGMSASGNNKRVTVTLNGGWTEEVDAHLIPINQGSSNAGKFLVVGSDGNVTTMTLQAWQGGSY